MMDVNDFFNYTAHAYGLDWLTRKFMWFIGPLYLMIGDKEYPSGFICMGNYYRKDDMNLRNCYP